MDELIKSLSERQCMQLWAILSNGPLVDQLKTTLFKKAYPRYGQPLTPQEQKLWDESMERWKNGKK